MSARLELERVQRGADVWLVERLAQLELRAEGGAKRVEQQLARAEGAAGIGQAHHFTGRVAQLPAHRDDDLRELARSPAEDVSRDDVTLRGGLRHEPGELRELAAR